MELINELNSSSSLVSGWYLVGLNGVMISLHNGNALSARMLNECLKMRAGTCIRSGKYLAIGEYLKTLQEKEDRFLNIQVCDINIVISLLNLCKSKLTLSHVHDQASLRRCP